MKTVFFTILSDDYKDTIIDFQGFYKSFKHFHPDIDMVVFDTKNIKKLFSKKRWLNFMNSKPSFAKLLYNDYDLVVNVDADFYFFDRCEEILKANYEIAACANFNIVVNTDIKHQIIKNILIHHVSSIDFIQGGLVASTSKQFWDDYEDLNKKIAHKLPHAENDVLNQIWYSGKYKTCVLDGHVDFRNPEFKAYYNCAGLGRELQYTLMNNKITLDNKPVRSYHVALGSHDRNRNLVRKRRFENTFNTEIVEWFNRNVMKNEI
jgi:hypothetical protein